MRAKRSPDPEAVVKEIRHTRGKPYHPMTQGKIERYHRSMKDILLLDNYYSPDDLNAEFGKFADYYNRQRYYESLDSMTPADAYAGRATAIFELRERTKRETINRRRIRYRKAFATRQSSS